MYWALVMNWTATVDKPFPEFVQICLQQWIPFYHLKNVNPALASLGQSMGILKNASIIRELTLRPQYMYIKEKILKMVKFYLTNKKSAHDNEEEVEEELFQLPG